MVRRLLLLVLLVSAALVVHTRLSGKPAEAGEWSERHSRAVTHLENKKHARHDGRVMIEKNFSVSPGGKLEVRVSDANVMVETGGGAHAEVRVTLDGRDMKRARAYFDRQNFRIEQRGGVVSVTTDPERAYGVVNNGGANIQVLVRIPSRFNVQVGTSDGNVTLGAIDGDVAIRTSDGNVRLADARGPGVVIQTSDGDISADRLESRAVKLTTSDGNIRVGSATGEAVSLHTSDGDISADQLSGTAEVVTSDGNVRIGRIDGPSARLHTSDGDISADALAAASADVTASDGNVRLGGVAGPLHARTSSGDLTVEIARPADIRLRADDGNIRVSAHGSYGAHLKLKGDHIRLPGSYNFKGYKTEEQADGELNGGGPTLEAVSSSGTVSFDEL